MSSGGSGDDSLFWAIQGKLAGRPGPDFAPWDLPALRAAGVATIVSLEEDCQGASIRAAGFRHLERFMPRSFPTSPALVEHFVGLTRSAALDVVAEVRAGSCVLAHCYAGRDRTGLVLCAALVELEGLSAQEAFRRVRAAQPQALTGPGILEVLKEYDLRLRAGGF